MGAYASLQDWNGVFRFDYGGHKDGDIQKPILYFSTNRDPIAQFSDRFGKLMFLNRAVRKSNNRITFLVDRDAAVDEHASDWNRARVSDQLRTLGLYRSLAAFIVPQDTKTAFFRPLPFEDFSVLSPRINPETLSLSHPSFKDGPDLLKELKKAGLIPDSVSMNSVVSETGEIIYDKQKQQLKVVTPAVEVLIAPAGNKLSGRHLEAEISDARAVIGLGSLDGQPILSSERMLLAHLTDVQNTGITFRTRKRRIMTNRGKAPILIKGGRANIRIKHFVPDKLKVFALDGRGKHLYEVETKMANGACSFTVSTISEKGNSLSYEIILEQK
jgi:hypothetical protein